MFLPLKKKKKQVHLKTKKRELIPSTVNLNVDATKMNELHVTYMKQCLYKNNRWINEQELPLTVLKCALEGAKIKIVDSKQKSYIGKEGIVLMETKYTIVLLENKSVCTVIKRNLIFELEFSYKQDLITVLLYGNGILNRSFNKKYKAHPTIEFQ